MNKKTMFLGVAALVLGAVYLLPQTVSAYKGDPTVKGPNYTEERHDAMTKAFANRDYNAWKALMDGRGVARVVTAEKFARFVESHDLALQGRIDVAKQIRTELGLGLKNGSGQGKGQGVGCANMNR